MPTPTYTPLATVTLGASASSVTFSSIPATYRDLICVINALGTTSTFLIFRVNGETGSIYSRVSMFASTSGVGSFSSTATSLQGLSDLNSTAYSMDIVQLMDYSATDKHKSTLSRTNDPNVAATVATAGRIATTSAINSIALSPNSGNFAAGSTFNLYGVIA
jgi:hypothetical protein